MMAVSVDVLGYTDSEEGIWYWDGDSYKLLTIITSHLHYGRAPGQAFFVSSPYNALKIMESTFSFKISSH